MSPKRRVGPNLQNFFSKVSRGPQLGLKPQLCVFFLSLSQNDLNIKIALKILSRVRHLQLQSHVFFAGAISYMSLQGVKSAFPTSHPSLAHPTTSPRPKMLWKCGAGRFLLLAGVLLVEICPAGDNSFQRLPQTSESTSTRLGKTKEIKANPRMSFFFPTSRI